MRKLTLIPLLLIIFSCQQKPGDKTIRADDDTIVSKNNGSEQNKQIGDTIDLLFKDKKGNYVAEGEIDSTHPRIYVKFVNEHPVNLNAVITSVSSNGNIRFNQILFPDKTADGPFGKELKLQLKQTGGHTLIIGYSLMADNPYQGKFRLNLKFTGK